MKFLKENQKLDISSDLKVELEFYLIYSLEMVY